MNELLASERPDRIATDEVTDGFIGQAPAFRDVLAKLPKLASADAAVLISGETGTGKELVARAIHGMSRRTVSPFVAVNCGALIDTLFESELFGHERGAFTDAHTRRQGLMAQAAGGTLFLDEVDTLTPRGQVALLRALQDPPFPPAGVCVGAARRRAVPAPGERKAGRSGPSRILQSGSVLSLVRVLSDF